MTFEVGRIFLSDSPQVTGVMSDKVDVIIAVKTLPTQ